jgi:hypothetical protein
MRAQSIHPPLTYTARRGHDGGLQERTTPASIQPAPACPNVTNELPVSLRSLRRRRHAVAAPYSAKVAVVARARRRDGLSSRSRRIWCTTVMTVEPPGEPSASSGWPSPSTIVGRIELRGRLPPSTRFGWANESKLTSVSSLLSRNPALHHDAVAAGRVDRERVGQGVARAVGGGMVPKRRSWRPDDEKAREAAGGHVRVIS